MAATDIGPVSTRTALEHRPHSDVLEHAQRRFAGNGYLRSRSIRCSFRQGVLTLSGRVPTYYIKQLAQELLRAIDGVECIANELKVEVAVTTTRGPYDD